MPMIPVDTAVQIMVGPLIDDVTFKDRELAVAYNATGMDVDLLKSSDTGVPTTTAITLTTGGTSDWIELSGGYYYVEVTAAQNNTEGKLKLIGIADGILPFESIEYDVVPVQVYNSLVAGTDDLDVEVATIAASAITATAIATDAIAAAKIAAGAITAAKFGAGAIDATAIATGAIDADAIAADAITSAKIATDAIGATEIAAGAIAADAFAAGAIDATALNATAVTKITDDVIETEGNITMQEALSLILAAVGGVTDTNGTVFRDGAGTNVRITATTDASNNRTVMVYAPSA